MQTGALDPRTRYSPGGPLPYPRPDEPPVALHCSAPSLPLANGSGTAIYDVHERAVTGFFNHMYKKYDKGSVTADLCHKAAMHVQDVDEPGQLGYINGTGIIKETRRHGPLQVEHYTFMPMGSEQLMVMLTRVTNTGTAPVDTSVTADLDFHVGRGQRPDPNNMGDDLDHKWHGDQNEVLEGHGSTVYEYSPDQPHMMAYRAIGMGGATRGRQRGDHLKAAFGESLQGLAPGHSRWSAVVVGHAEQGDFQGPEWHRQAEAGLSERIDGYLKGRSPEQLLHAEQCFWNGYHAAEPKLDGLPLDQQAVYRQSTAFLKMGQVQEGRHPESSGQVLASLKDKWARSWVRDASYAIVGLVRSGHLDEAGKAIDFMLRGSRDPDHDYLGMVNADQPEGKKLESYLVSACRYFGNGQEESDWNDHGPNIEFDDFGLFLWAYSEYAQALPADQRQQFLERTLKTVDKGVAEPLVKLENDKHLINPDSSIWEHHWSRPLEYDGRRHYAYTTITAANGLKSFAGLLEQNGQADDAQRLRQSACSLQEGLKAGLSHPDGTLASSLEDLHNDPSTAHDAATLEAVNWGLIQGEQAHRTVDNDFQELRSRTPGSPGVMRNDDGNWYDSQEWLLLDLRGVEALGKVGEKQRAGQLMDWVTSWAHRNYDGIGELLDEKGNFEGPFPMAGFGPGAYVLAASALQDSASGSSGPD